MRHSVARRLFGALATACFALSAVTWGTMPGCAAGTAASGGHVAHHGAAHEHTGAPGKLPAGVTCVVHLCCIQLITPAAPTLAVARISVPEPASGFTATSLFIPVRPPHALPFAQAPPLTPV
jgi:hypothetical protein